MKIGLVLSGGSARGLAHIGVIKVLEKYGIIPSVIAANSMGGIIGAMYAKTLKIKDVENYINNVSLLDFLKFFDFTISKEGIFKGNNFTNIINEYLGNINFEDLMIPLLVNATNFDTGEEVIISNGKVSDGIRATISLPALLKPVKYKNSRLVDGTLINPLPLNLLDKFELDMIICSNVLANLNDQKSNKINEILSKSFIIMSNEIIKLKLKDHKYDFIINPDVSNFEFHDFLKRKKIIKEGEKAAKKEINNILNKSKSF